MLELLEKKVELRTKKYNLWNIEGIVFSAFHTIFREDQERILHQNS